MYIAVCVHMQKVHLTGNGQFTFCRESFILLCAMKNKLQFKEITQVRREGMV